MPAYVTIDSITEMNDNAAKFDNRIIGIDPGAGLMSKTEKVLQDAIKNDDWVVVTGWTPHWKFARWDLKYLADPKGVYGGEEQINTIVRKGLQKDMPQVYTILDNFHWQPDDMAELMVWNQEDGADPYENAKRWVKENQDKVQSWISE